MTKLRPKDLAGLLLELTDGVQPAHDKILAEFVTLVAKKRMLGSADEIISEYEKLYNHKHGIIEAHITTTNKLESGLAQKLREELKGKYKANEVHLEEKIDSRLIGGMKVRVGDTIYDTSLKNTLNQLQAKLTA